ncbi:uncharacterized protein K02A2.6-like [Ornithodoros turicata]|uniref:uncharacterized protein K02A2.6-like n=1 Tax=Ornithodoros turicata TaxID=34597 RepID=UPI003139DB43
MAIIVVRNRGKKLPVLMGRNWLEKLRLDWSLVGQVTADYRVEEMRKKFPDVFDSSPGLIKEFQAKIIVKDGSTPVFCKARSIPFAVRNAVAEQLDELEKTGIVKHVTQSEWATPLVVVPKKNGEGLRLCGEYKVTINPVLQTEHYLLPHLEELCSVLAGGSVFCVLDLSSAYHQIEVAPECRQLLTVNTHLGLYQFQRLPFGISSAPAIFQSLMDKVLKDIPQVGRYIDDVIIAGKDIEDCSNLLETVLKRLNKYN